MPIQVVDDEPRRRFEAVAPEDQQEDEGDLKGPISFKDAMVMSTDWTIETINSQVSKGNIDLNPDFQRRGAWDAIRQSRLIESIIVGMPVPNIVLAEAKGHRGRFFVIDGKQRLLAISDFLRDGLVLKGLDIRPTLEGRRYSTLDAEDREALDNSTLRSTLIRNWADDKFLYAMFYRLNSGSLPLSPQELRKALLGGKLIDYIEEYLRTSKAFQALFGTELDRRMRDSELVLRFLAFDLYYPAYEGDLKEFLDRTARHYAKSWKENLSDLNLALGRLDVALQTADSVFGSHSFKKWIRGGYERRINRAIFDCIVRYFSQEEVADAACKHQEAVLEAYQKTCMDPKFLQAVERTTKSVDATKSRLCVWGYNLSLALGLAFNPETVRLEPPGGPD